RVRVGVPAGFSGLLGLRFLLRKCRLRQESKETRWALLARQARDKTDRKAMNDKFDELAKGLAQSVTRRQALRKFSAGLAGSVLASLALPSNAHADPKPKKRFHCICNVPGAGCDPSSPDYDACITY